MDDRRRKQDQGASTRPQDERPPRAAEPQPNVVTRRDDPHLSPAGSGPAPGRAPDTFNARSGGVSGPHGAEVPGEDGGPSGEVERENRDALPRARRDETAGETPEGNEAERGEGGGWGRGV